MPTKTVNLIYPSVNLLYPNNGVGLKTDADVVHAALNKDFVVYHNLPKRCDIGIHFEIPKISWWHLFKKNYWFPNPEWTYSYWLKYNKRFTILAKSLHAFNIFSGLRFNTIYTGFTSQDRHIAEQDKDEKWLHLIGKSRQKNTEAVIDAFNYSEPLTIVSHGRADYRSLVESKNITYIYEYLADEELRALQNSHKFHICPSEAEGFGHYINEARSVGAVIITSDYAPMSELITDATGLRVRGHIGESMGLSNKFEVRSEDISKAVLAAKKLDTGPAARAAFLRDKTDFETRLKKELI